ncbi:MAG: ABC transporter permease [Candidatus Saganbacteria bacterium]|nr:ABC transporter permease [Candidatus Saganbacteria bacterium]
MRFGLSIKKEEKYFDYVGKETLLFFRDFGGICILLWQALTRSFTKKLNIKNVYDQLVRIGNDSIPVSLITAFFVGMVFAVQIATEFTKFGAGRMVGAVMALAIARELAPILTAVVLAGRVGAAIAAEIGTMNVTQQIDAMRALGTNPINYLVVPRFLASVIMFPVLTLFADLIGFIGSFLVSVFLANINPYSYLEATEQFLKTGDILAGLLKAVVFGALVSIIACQMGLNSKNGAKGVGEATTASVVISLITIFVANYFMSVALFK